MAAVAKITYGPLIDHLKESADVYKYIYLQYEMKYGTIDKNVFGSWMAQVVEPVMIRCTQNQPDAIPRLFKVLYIASLEIIGNGSAAMYAHQYESVWKLYGLLPALMQRSSGEIVIAIHEALANLRKHLPHQVMTWISGMEDSVRGCSSVADVLACGRIHAWLCGMAHLRSRAIASFPLLPEKIQEDIKKKFPAKADINSLTASPWIGLNKISFMGETGGFTGMGGNFTKPPVAAVLHGKIVLTDGTNTCALYADSLGTILIPNVPVLATNVLNYSSVEGLKEFTRKNKALVPFDDASSFAHADYTFVITRKLSHYTFIYGCSA